VAKSKANLYCRQVFKANGYESIYLTEYQRKTFVKYLLTVKNPTERIGLRRTDRSKRRGVSSCQCSRRWSFTWRSLGDHRLCRP